MGEGGWRATRLQAELGGRGLAREACRGFLVHNLSLVVTALPFELLS